MPTLAPTSEDTRVYEIAVMLPPDLSPKAESELTKRIDAALKEAGATIVFSDVWSRRGLAYSIRGHREAKFIIHYIEVDPSKIRELDGALKLDRDVLRHLIVIPPKGYEAVSYEDKYKEWIATRESAADMRKREHEEKMKERIAAKAKMDAKRHEAQKRKAKKDTDDDSESDAGRISEELDKLISDEDLDI